MFEIAILSGVIGAILGHVLTRLRDVRTRLDRLPRVEAKVDALIAHTGITFDPFKNVAANVKDALLRGEKIRAIQHYRAATGAGLKEAKDAIEDLERLKPTLH
jgi:ribosomal protein L7/L12